MLADAYVELRRRTGDAPIRLDAAGYLSRAHEPYLEDVRDRLDKAGLKSEFTYHGAVDRSGKLAFLRSIDVLSVPATYDEPKGVFLLEAMASGVPVVQPRRGAFTEMVEKTGGGLLVAPDQVGALAEGLHTLWRDRSLTEKLGSERSPECAITTASRTRQIVWSRRTNWRLVVVHRLRRACALLALLIDEQFPGPSTCSRSRTSRRSTRLRAVR